MKKFNVHWCDIHDTCGGCLKVEADSRDAAVAAARHAVKLGCNFHLVAVYEVK